MKTALLFFLILFCVSVSAQERKRAFEMNERLGRGINIGNSFDAPSEEAWFNPWNPDYFRMIAELGFSHVRMPVYWETIERSSPEYPFTINQNFLERIKYVVDEALKNKLHIIINMHHHNELVYNFDETKKSCFLSQWSQIADYFKEYPDSLLFEVLNEPNGEKITPSWNGLVSDALSEIRKSTDRTVLITGEWNSINGLRNLQLPDDDNIILTLHYYNPQEFTHQGAEWTGTNMDIWLGTEWHGSEPERQVIIDEFKYVNIFSAENNIPVHIGEFGSNRKADMESRKRWTTYLCRFFEEQGFSWSYWDFSTVFGIYDLETKTYFTPLVDALTKESVPEPAAHKATSIYASDFTVNEDYWGMYKQEGAVADLKSEDGKLKVTVSSGGTAEWYVQLVRSGMRLEKDRVYRLSFTMSSEETRWVVAHVDYSNPYIWGTYSGYDSFIVGNKEETFTTMFIMKETDLDARLLFDVGLTSAPLAISNIQIDEIEIIPTVIDGITETQNAWFYPNPIRDELIIRNDSDFDIATVISPSGAQLVKQNVKPGMNSIDASNWTKGVYFVVMEGKGSRQVVKVLKE